MDHPTTSGVHRPVAIEHAGDGVEKAFVFVLGEEVSDDGTRTSLMRYRTDSGNPPNESRITWPKNPDEGIYRPVAMHVQQGWGPPVAPSIDIYALLHVEKDDGQIRTMTLAFTEDEDSEEMILDWAREFDRGTDDNDDVVPVAITATDGLVAVLVEYYSEGNTRVTYGLNVYHKSDGTNFISARHLLDLPGNHYPVDVLFPDDRSAFLTGYTTDPQTGFDTFLTVAYDLHSDSPNFGDFLKVKDPIVTCWDPFDVECDDAHVRFSLPEYHVRPFRMVKKRASDSRVHIGGNAFDVGDTEARIVVKTFETHKVDQRFVQWADLYSSSALADVGRDIDAASAVGHSSLEGNSGYVWVAGSSYGSDSRARVRVLQYNDNAAPDCLTAFPYCRLEPEPTFFGWAAEWEYEQGLHAEGFRVIHLRDEFGNPSNRVDPPQIYIAAHLQQNAQADWELGVLKYDARLPTGPSKETFWRDDFFVLDGLSGGNHEPPVGLDARLPNDTQVHEYPRFWFGSPADLGSTIRWYTTQWVDLEW